VRLASTAEEFEREITAALSAGAAGEEQRREFAKENTWKRRFEVLDSAIRAVMVRPDERRPAT
jgi:hypothetical protein